jgi:hypothetical protein
MSSVLMMAVLLVGDRLLIRDFFIYSSPLNMSISMSKVGAQGDPCTATIS